MPSASNQPRATCLPDRANPDTSPGRWSAFALALLLLGWAVPCPAAPAPGGERIDPGVVGGLAQPRPDAVEPAPVRVAPLAAGDFARIAAAGFDIAYQGTDYAEILTRESDLERLRAMGFAPEPLGRDLFPGARSGSREGNLDPQYHTFQEMLAELEALAATYPSLCRLYDIGDAESRHWTWSNYPHAYDIWAVRISDHPDRDEPEPCIVYDGRHHAREPVSTEIVLAIAQRLCEGYGIDPEITAIVDETEIWCVPMVNPDGHQWVEDHDPWWRKTLWDYDQDHLVDANEGIDANRDYDWHWYGGGWSDETYGGPYPWSAREAAALRDLLDRERAALNPSFHSYGEQVLYPFGYGVAPEPAVIEVSGEYAGRIGYALLQSTTTSGSSKDWAYGTTGAVSFTVETATDFIPTGVEMESVVAELLPGSLWLASRLHGPAIQGTVTDSLIGIPLAATIHIPEIQEFYGQGELEDMRTEAATGFFCRLRPAAVATITLEVSAPDYQSKSVQVVTGGTEPTLAQIELVPLSFAHGVLAGVVRNATAGDEPLPGATVTVLPAGPSFQSGPDGGYVGYVDPGIYTVRAAHPSCAPDTAQGVAILLGETTTVDFALADIAAPAISATTLYPSTGDTLGPYSITTTLTDLSGLAEAQLRYRRAGGEFVGLPLYPIGPDRYQAGIPGQPYWTWVEYYIFASDPGGNAATDPAGAPDELYRFWVAPEVELFADDIEEGAANWEHSAVTGGFLDQWHLSTQRNHTPLGATSWKCGDAGAGDYANLLDAGLVTPAFPLGVQSRLTFWHWIEAEESQSFPGQAYDGGLVEISTDGTTWVQIEPLGGYSHVCRLGSIPGPFPAGTPMFSGTHDWGEVVFDLAAYSGTAQLRFRFGTDGADAREGWYIDDVRVSGLANASSIAESTPAPGRAPARLVLSPNPLNQIGIAQISYRLEKPARVSIEIYDPVGRFLRRLNVATSSVAGVLDWDGRDAAGRLLGSGVYWVRIDAGNGLRTARKITVVR